VLKHRLIAVILVRDGRVVQSVKFKHTNVIHSDPIHAIESFNKWAIDEIVVLNVSRDESAKSDFTDVIRRISTECFVPLSAGGWITDIEHARSILSNGADKLIVNTLAFLHPEFISELAQKFGNQCIVISIDSKKDENGKEFVTIDRGRRITNVEPADWARKAESLGAGEILINSIDFDGNRKGYNLDLIKSITDYVSIPVIAMGGVFTWDHLSDGITMAKADAVAAANIFHYTEHSTKKAKKYLLDSGLNFRKI
jgi:imidazole glycerol-phosphate synthase subunit HisF